MALSIPAVAAMVMVPPLQRGARLRLRKKRVYSHDQAIAKLPDPKTHVEMQSLNTLLDQRNHLRRVSSWPCLGNIGRLLFACLSTPHLGWGSVDRAVSGRIRLTIAPVFPSVNHPIHHHDQQ